MCGRRMLPLSSPCCFASLSVFIAFFFCLSLLMTKENLRKNKISSFQIFCCSLSPFIFLLMHFVGPNLCSRNRVITVSTRVGILILATPRQIGYKNCWSDAPMQQQGWVLPPPTYIMGAVHHEMGLRSSQLIVSRCRDSV